ncbi:MAG: serine/threonine protein kinase [Myxococcales bacterium]|nr:serine/threonine protein kinase [Myxococcales bacterium]
MATGEDDTASGATVAERPSVIGTAAPSDQSSASAEATVELPASRATPLPPPAPTPTVSGSTPSLTRGTPLPGTLMTTAADAMRDEEIERTRLFIRMGWAISVVSIGTVPFLNAPRVMSIAFIAAMLIGIGVSLVFHQRFADPAKYTENSLLGLSVMCVVNAHVAVAYFGTFTVTPVIIVIGIHFVARTEAVRAARYIFATAVVCYSALATLIVARVFADPGVFATGVKLAISSQLIGAGFVLGTYALAYYTARAFRRASLASIEDLQKATRLASQREALMEELRADLERALRVGGAGRYTDQVVGEFKLGAVLGRGAMGEVYEATHTATGEAAAVKLLRRELLSDPTHVARFLREVRASGSLDSPYTIKILDASADNATTPFLAMERLRGATLAELLRKDPKLSGSSVAVLVRQVGAGIDAATAAGIVHRDLKPQNLFLTDGPVPVWKILDFGVATLTEESSGTLTQGGIVGTPNYMAPEQAQGKQVDGRADVYAVAAVAYRALTGRHPFNAPDTPALLYAVVHKMPSRPGEHVEIDPDVDRWFALALAKSPDDRFPTGAEAAERLVSALAGELEPKLRKRADALIRKHPWD